MDDLISRQAVLDKAYELDLIDTGNDIRVWVVDVAEVEKLPIVEIIRCKDCQHYDNAPCGIVDWWNSKDDFCSKAERRTDE